MEKLIKVECIERDPPPSLSDEFPHKDWVSCVHSTEDLYATLRVLLHHKPSPSYIIIYYCDTSTKEIQCRRDWITGIFLLLLLSLVH